MEEVQKTPAEILDILSRTVLHKSECHIYVSGKSILEDPEEISYKQMVNIIERSNNLLARREIDKKTEEKDPSDQKNANNNNRLPIKTKTGSGHSPE